MSGSEHGQTVYMGAHPERSREEMKRPAKHKGLSEAKGLQKQAWGMSRVWGWGSSFSPAWLE